jgi:organic hydroperoxide reductase OsmC/OhrA
MAHVHTALIRWSAGGVDFLGRRYSRAHTWTFDGGAVVPGSSSPLVVPLPMSDAGAVDPEEAFVAALSSCHMLWFLDLASRAGYAVDSYEDAAEGRMGRNADGKLVVDVVTLRPRTRVTGARVPDAAELAALHHRAHEECFLANSVRCEIRCEPALDRE